jgi:hypothetical protein
MMRKLLLALLFVSVTNLADAAVCGNKAMKYFSVGLVDEEAGYEKINKPSAIKMYWSKGDLPAKIVWKKLEARKNSAQQLFSFKKQTLAMLSSIQQVLFLILLRKINVLLVQSIVGAKKSYLLAIPIQFTL